MKYSELEQNLIWIYHNDHAQWERWAYNLRDMWTGRWTRSHSQQKWRKLRQSGVEPASIEAVFEAISEVLEQNDFNKLMILFKM